MKKLAGAYRHQLLRIFHSYRIYICIIAYVIICLYMEHTPGISKISSRTVFEGLSNIAGFNNMNKIPVIIAAIPMATSFCDDISNNYFNPYVLRCGKKNYIISKLTTCFFSSFIVSFTGLSVYSIISGAINGLGIRQIHEYRVFHDIAYGKYPIAAVIIFIFLFSMVSGVYAVMGMALSAAVPNRFVAVTSAFFISMFVENVLDFLPTSISLFEIQKGNKAFFGMNSGYILLLSCMVCLGYILLAAWVFKHFAERRI